MNYRLLQAVRIQDGIQPWGACSPKAVFRPGCIARQRGMSMKRSGMRIAPRSIDPDAILLSIPRMYGKTCFLIAVAGYRSENLPFIPRMYVKAHFIIAGTGYRSGKTAIYTPNIRQNSLINSRSGV